MTQAVTRYEPTQTPAPIDFTTDQLAVIKTTIAKGASDTELQLFVATCRRTGLDPFLKQIYAVKRYDSREKKEVMAIQVGIDGLRLIADRTDRYAGQDPIEWLDTDGVWSEVWTGIGGHPVAARTAVYRKDWGERKAPAVCRWDSYAQYFGSEHKLSPTWAAMPDVMLGKCAEALALRRAFPAEMSGVATIIDPEYTPETDAELQQANVINGEILPPPTPISDDQRRRLNAAFRDASKVWSKEAWGELMAGLRRDYPAAFQAIGPSLLKALSGADAEAVMALIEHGAERPAADSVANLTASGSEDVARPTNEPAGAPPTPACDHDPVFDEKTTLMVCNKCGLVLEEPGATEATEQPGLPV